MLLVFCYIVAYTLGTITDVVVGYMGVLFPRCAAIFALIPLGVIASIVRQEGSMNNKTTKQEKFFRANHVHGNIYKVKSLAFALGSIVNLLSQKVFYKESGVEYIDEFSIFLIIIALLNLIVDKIKISGIYKEMIIAISYTIVIPYITLRYVQYGSITIWAFVFLLFIICLIYNRQVLLVTTAVTALMTQLLVWAITPTVLVEVNMADYIVRLCLIGISVFFSVYVNYLYVENLKENTSYSDKETILSEISRDFISAEDWNKDNILNNILKKCGKFVGSERAYMFFFDQDTKKIQYSFEWVDEGIHSDIKRLDVLGSDMVHRITRLFENKRVITINDLKNVLPEENGLNTLIGEDNIRGMVNLPLIEKDEIIGVMGYDSSRPLSEWNLDSTDFIEIIANLVSDMILKIKAEEKNKALAYYDQLTQLPNRVLFNCRLEQEINLAKGTGKMIGIVFIDIDSFKTLNDTMGHSIGDKVLFEVAQVIEQSINECDTVARFGGDEFVIILNNITDQQNINEIMDNLVSAMNEPFNLNGQEFFVTFSAGIALYPYDGEDADSLIKNADTAMYMAKDMGKNRYLMCSQNMKDQVLDKLVLANNLNRALEKGQLILHYQPQIDLETKKIVGFEALLRWSLPGKGIISPVVFIPIAEKTGLINQIGEWVLETACRQNKLWHDKGYTGLRMAVNISIYQLNNPKFVQQVEGILKKTGLNPKDLELEITESTVSKDDANVAIVLSDLKELGVTISIDDFGTEYSSLSRLKLLPIDRIKIDLQFVQGIEVDEKDRAITELIINLAKSMNLKVIAEGVETKEQLDFLYNRLCDEVQEYYYYKPMPAEEIERLF